jgi:ABC-type nitrate/sulfonate/bicarbonate transport system substrate-binding protein
MWKEKRRMWKEKRRMVLFFVFFIFWAPCFGNAQTQKELKTITLLLDWKSNTNHVGFYVAENKGFYKKNNLQLKILNPTQTTTNLLVASQKAAFGITYANQLMLAREAGLPLVAIAGILAEDTSCFVWRKSLNIKGPKDFEGKRYGGWGSLEEEATLKYIVEKNQGDFKKIKILTMGFQDFLTATQHLVDVTWEYQGWGILAAKLHGVSVGTYCPQDHFPVFRKPSPLIVSSEKFLKENRSVVQDFLEATALGFEYAQQFPERAAQELLFSVPELDPQLVKASLNFLAPLYGGPGPIWGFLNKKHLENYAKWMLSSGLIHMLPQGEGFVNNSFLPQKTFSHQGTSDGGPKGGVKKKSSVQ